jgi:predicted metal-dependent phosphoesterase TrpH
MTGGAAGAPLIPPDAARTVDLHTHSTASDGAASPGELAARAAAAGLVAIALTDHDTVDGVTAARTAGAAIGIEVIAGIELSASEGDQEVHLLGLHLSSIAPIAAKLDELRLARSRRAETIVGVLRAAGIPVTLEAVLVEAGTGAIGRPHVARALIAGGWVRDQREAFERYLGAGRPANVAKQRLSVSEAIAMVHAAGGVAVVAHPGRDGTRERLEALQAAGVDGVEVRHPSHSAEDVARLGALAAHLGLLPSGGSDWHGATEGPRVLGALKVPAAWAALQAERAHKYRSPDGGVWNSANGSRS